MRWWESELGRSLPVAQFGENLTMEGIDVNGALVGERWEVGTTLLEVSEPRVPCWRLGVRMDDMGFIRRFTEALRPGAYLRIISEGSVAAGDAIRVLERPDQRLSVRDVLRIYSRDRQEAGRLLAVAADVRELEGMGAGATAKSRKRCDACSRSRMLLVGRCDGPTYAHAILTIAKFLAALRQDP
jgi:MOSC domain-containing protein YiiM